MANLQEKIQDISFAIFVVRCLRQKYKYAKQHFHCHQDVKNTDVMVDNFSGGAHIIDVKPMRCFEYDSYTACDNSGCPNHNWNNQYVDLLKRFRVAKQDRNQKILNLFGIHQK